MADNQRKPTTEAPDSGKTDNLDRERTTATDSDAEHEQIRSSNDRDQALEREGITSKHNRGYDEAAHGQRGPTDPDSAESDNDRDDTLTD